MPMQAVSIKAARCRATGIETHISVVYFAGRYAYKFRRLVDFGFVNFVRLDARLR